MTIWKYELEITDRQTIQMPEGSQILSVANQNGKLCLWAIVSPANSDRDRVIEIIGTGNPMRISNRKFIGTVVIDPFVRHVFEIV